MKTSTLAITSIMLWTLAGNSQEPLGKASGSSSVLAAVAPSFSSQSGKLLPEYRLNADAWPVCRVMVGPGWARVTRGGKVSFHRGSCRVILEGLPAWVDTSLLQAKTGDGALLLGVRGSWVETPYIPDEAVKAEERELADLDLRITEAGDRLRALSDQADYLTAFRPVLAVPETGKDGKMLPQTAENIREISEYLAEARLRIVSQQAETTREMEHLRQELKERREQLEKTRIHPPVRKTEILIDLRGENETGTDIEVTYLIAGASWYPEHALLLNGTSSGGELRRQAVVQQATGEIWEDCPVTATAVLPLEPLTLEDIVPSPLAGQPPNEQSNAFLLPGLKLNPEVTERLSRIHALWRNQESDNAETRAAIQRVCENLEQMRQILAEMPDSGTWPACAGQSPVRLPPDGVEVTVPGRTFPLETRLSYVVAPSVTPTPNGILRLTNPGSETLPPGWLVCSRDGHLTARSRMNGMQPGEHLDIPIGPTEGLEVSKVLSIQDSRLDILGAARQLTVAYAIRITGSAIDPVRIHLAEPLPACADPRIRMALGNTEPRAILNEKGILEWTFDLQPGTPANVSYSYTADYPGTDIPPALKALENHILNSREAKPGS